MTIFYTVKPLHPLWNGQLPVDPVLILRTMLYQNQKVKVFSSHNIEQVGMIERTEEGFNVTYNTQEQLVRQRYFLAFAVSYIEQGFMENQDCATFDSNSFTLTQLDKAKQKSNVAALELLMPQRIVNFLVFKKNMANIEDLANTFNVSTKAMQTQLKRCKLID